MDRKQLGAFGESWTARRLEEEGWHIAARNYRCPYGEIDLIAAKGAVLAFVEVKTRTAGFRYRPADAVTPAKRRKLRQAASCWLAEHETELFPRFDVAEVTVADLDGEAAVEDFCYWEAAFGGGEG